MKYGLTSAEAKASAELYGKNTLSSLPRATFWDKFKDNLCDPIIEILIVALLADCLFAYLGYGDWFETIGILAAILLATFVSTYSEYSNETAFQKLQEEASRIFCRVWRDGEPTEIRIDELVVGDVIMLGAGDKIPVDGVLVEGTLGLDQSALNGESDEAEKIVAPSDFQWDGEIDFLNKYRLYRGSVVVNGNAQMLAKCVGDKSVYGQLTKELQIEERPSPLKIKLEHLAKQIAKFGYAAGFLIAAAVFLKKYLAVSNYFAQPMQVVAGDVVNAVIVGIVIIVMAVPEGLPLMIAIVSSLNMKKMLNDNVLVRKLVGIETAGSLNLLFTDKTGTITKGHLEVVNFLTGNREEFKTFAELPATIKRYTYENIVVNTSATVTEDAILGGNMTEKALSDYIGKYRTGVPQRLQFRPFNSADKYSLAVTDGMEKLLVKGAPEKLLLSTDYYWDKDGQRQILTDAMKQNLDYRMVELARQAIRMLALCTAEQEQNGGEKGLTLVGILCIRDEVRAEAVSAIKAVQDAGVQVVMITGDRKETAAAIAKDAGLLRHPEELVWTSAELAAFSDEEVKLMLPKLRVVARALPMDKSRLVRIAQELNLVVGMTGDGVNDSPALKMADVGFAMGSGTDVAKEAGDIVILDDNFLSIKQAILYGRTIYKSICKFVTFQLTINVGAVAVNLIAPFLGVEHPLTIIQILWINLVMDTLAAIAFGGEPALEKYLREAPKKRTEKIVNRAMLTHICLAGAVILAAFSYFVPASRHIYFSNGIFFTIFIFLAVANAFVVRAGSWCLWEGLSRNKGFLSIMFLIVIVQVALLKIVY
ncbi:MAG: calcium-translocating P-type ATPase, PMCA-type [Acidaminococcaceae bacterium]|nr:calcium-translocating P-type ATPase, PMCA-type [Acidaminococcaceae bacterium]